MSEIEDDGFVTVVPDVSSQPVVEESLEAHLLRLCGEIHADNVAAGWWTDLHTGESILATRNRPEIMMLIVSELSEASQGAADSVFDDKLPHLRMFDVEQADAAIRNFDVLGADGAEEIPATILDELSEMFYPLAIDQCLMLLTNGVSVAMEHYRKGRRDHYVSQLAETQVAIFALAQSRNIDLFYIIEQKRAYNRQRADHKPENRRAAGGKAF